MFLIAAERETSCPVPLCQLSILLLYIRRKSKQQSNSLLEKRRLVDASIEVFQNRLRHIRCMSQSISPQQLAYMRSLKESTIHAFLPIRESSTASPVLVEVMSAGD